MSQKSRTAGTQVANLVAMKTHLCDCQPLSSLHVVTHTEETEQIVDANSGKPLVLVTQQFNAQLRGQLRSFFPRSTPFSLLLLHVFQVELLPILTQSSLPHQRQRYHAPEGLLDQILVNVRRAIRQDDQLLIDEHKGAVILFPDVDQQGIAHILERVYHSVSLLQAETVIPPLTLETSLLMGTGTYLEPATSLEQLLYYTGLVARNFTLQPVISTQVQNITDTADTGMQRAHITKVEQDSNDDTCWHNNAQIPFMRLPTELPRRLKQLIPYTVAVQLRCVPVGRNQHCLTVAMANPSRHETLQRLAALTGMTIFPVSCEDDALDLLLDQQW